MKTCVKTEIDKNLFCETCFYFSFSNRCIFCYVGGKPLLHNRKDKGKKALKKIFFLSEKIKFENTNQ